MSMYVRFHIFIIYIELYMNLSSFGFLYIYTEKCGAKDSLVSFIAYNYS
jgi:hypothetical protein